MIRIVIADDHPVVRAGIRRIIEAEPHMRVVAEATDGTELLSQLASTASDVVLVDIGMPGVGFLEVIRRLGSLQPHAKAIVLSVYPEDQYALRALRAGAAGYLSKDQSPEQLVQAVKRVYSGSRYISPTLAEWLATRVNEELPAASHEALSDREHQVLCMLGSGWSVKDIATSLSLSPKTVSTYRARVLQKLGMSTTADLVRYVVTHGLAT